MNRSFILPFHFNRKVTTVLDNTIYWQKSEDSNQKSFSHTSIIQNKSKQNEHPYKVTSKNWRYYLSIQDTPFILQQTSVFLMFSDSILKISSLSNFVKRFLFPFPLSIHSYIWRESDEHTPLWDLVLNISTSIRRETQFFWGKDEGSIN